jgi:hypothetical protein
MTKAGAWITEDATDICLLIETIVWQFYAKNIFGGNQEIQKCGKLNWSGGKFTGFFVDVFSFLGLKSDLSKDCKSFWTRHLYFGFVDSVKFEMNNRNTTLIQMSKRQKYYFSIVFSFFSCILVTIPI